MLSAAPIHLDESRGVAIEAREIGMPEPGRELALGTAHSHNFLPRLTHILRGLTGPRIAHRLAFYAAGINCPTTIEAQLGDFDVPSPGLRSDHDLEHSTRIDGRNAT